MESSDKFFGECDNCLCPRRRLILFKPCGCAIWCARCVKFATSREDFILLNCQECGEVVYVYERVTKKGKCIPFNQKILVS